jgi:DNA primase
MDNLELQKLRDLPIEGVARRLGLKVEKHKCLCPFHDDHHASMSFKVSRNTYRCFVCDAHGDTISLTMGCTGKSFREACRWLADDDVVSSSRVQGSSDLNHETRTMKPFNTARYARYFIYPSLSEAAKRFLYDERRIDPRVVSWCRLNSFRDWLQIPYYDREGHLTGIQSRYLGNDPSQPRFRFPQGSQCGIYNLPVLNRLQPGDELWITEGCSDCWAMLSAGHKAIAIPSATLLKRKDVEQLETLNLELGTPFHMFPDNDVPGERLFLQLKEKLPSLVRHQLPPGCKDFGEYYKSLTP